MTAWEYVGLGLICALAFALRTLPSSARRWFGNDSYSNLLVGRQYKKDGAFPKTYPSMFPANEHTYPPLFQAMMRPFAFSAERAAIRYLAPTFDTLTVVLVFLTAKALDISQPLVPSLFYALSYANMLEATTLNVRPLANLLMATTIVSIWWLPDEIGLGFLLVVMALEALVLLAHKLTVQVLIPLHLAVSLLYARSDLLEGVLLLVTLPAAFGLAHLLSGGRYLTKILPDHIEYIKVHLRRGDYRTGKKRVPSPANLAKSNPIAYISPFMGLALLLVWDSLDGLEIFLAWSILVFVLAQSWIWGDSWRYLQLGTFPSVLLILPFLDNLSISSTAESLVILAVTVALGVGCLVQLRATLRRDVAQKLVDAMDSLSPEWKNRLRGRKVFSNVRHFLIPYYTGASVMIGDPSAKGMDLGFRIEEKARTSFKEIAEWSDKELKAPVEYFLVFDGFPAPDTDDFEPRFKSKLIAVFAALQTQDTL
jgi:hypothetical protein